MSAPQAHPCCAPSSDTDGPAVPQTTAPPDLVDALGSGACGQLTLVGLPAGRFLMGSQDAQAYPEDGEGPVREVEVGSFAMASTTVTVAEFAVFVAETDHRTDAEVHGDSLVFSGLLSPQVRRDAAAVRDAPWWRAVPGACWYAPEGRGSTVRERAEHPVTHVSHRDARAYAEWVGARLPTEAEWEYACRGGLVQQPFPWGGVREPEGRRLMNTFSGEFPERPDGTVGTVAVRSFPPNRFGLFETTGNVWEWTSEAALRGGSYMCHDSYCRRYRTSARTVADPETSLGHTGFRLASDL